jgi:hypothetical protein
MQKYNRPSNGQLGKLFRPKNKNKATLSDCLVSRYLQRIKKNAFF